MLQPSGVRVKRCRADQRRGDDKHACLAAEAEQLQEQLQALRTNAVARGNDRFAEQREVYEAQINKLSRQADALAAEKAHAEGRAALLQQHLVAAEAAIGSLRVRSASGCLLVLACNRAQGPRWVRSVSVCLLISASLCLPPHQAVCLRIRLFAYLSMSAYLRMLQSTGLPSGTLCIRPFAFLCMLQSTGPPSSALRAARCLYSYSLLVLRGWNFITCSQTLRPFLFGGIQT